MSRDAVAPVVRLHGDDAGGEGYFAGQVIAAKYRLERLLGQGGMGSVWLARNLTLEVDVAIKLVRLDVAREGTASERLLREARAAARLDHPSIVRVFDFGEAESGEPFIVMEVVRGEPLVDLIARAGRLSPVTAVQMILPVVDALSVVHARRIVHRDVKPDNIILVSDDKGHVVPKLVDFGIAKDTPHQSDAPVLAHDRAPKPRALTQTGVILGSPGYLSPEQAMSRGDVGAASDIWSLSVVLYEMLSGELPFDHEDLRELVLAVIRDPPRSLSDLGVADAELWTIVERGLHKDPQQRWPGMRAMGGALATWLARQGVRADISGSALETHWGCGAPIVEEPSVAEVAVAETVVAENPSSAAETRPRWGLAAGVAATTMALVTLILHDQAAPLVLRPGLARSILVQELPAASSISAFEPPREVTLPQLDEEPLEEPLEASPAPPPVPRRLPRRKPAVPDDPGF